jgi:hypothetical protein
LKGRSRPATQRPPTSVRRVGCWPPMPGPWRFIVILKSTRGSPGNIPGNVLTYGSYSLCH